MKFKPIFAEIMSPSVIVDLEDSSFVPKYFIGSVVKDGSYVRTGEGHDDGTNHYGYTTTDNGTKGTFISDIESLILYDGNTVRDSGHVSNLSLNGMIGFTFDNYTDGDIIIGTVFGE